MKRMHEQSSKKKMFECGKCKKEYKQEANLRNHEKICLKEEEEDGKKECELCKKRYKTSYIKQHKRACKAAQGGDQEVERAQPLARVYKAERKPCPQCGKVMAATNISRHLKEACR